VPLPHETSVVLEQVPDELTGVVFVAELLLEFGSAAPVSDTLALFVIEVPEPAVTDARIFSTVAPAETAAWVHVPTPAEMPQDHVLDPFPALAPEIDVKVPLVAVSVTVIDPLTSGPALVTVNV